MAIIPSDLYISDASFGLKFTNSSLYFYSDINYSSVMLFNNIDLGNGKEYNSSNYNFTNYIPPGTYLFCASFVSANSNDTDLDSYGLQVNFYDSNIDTNCSIMNNFKANWNNIFNMSSNYIINTIACSESILGCFFTYYPSSINSGDTTTIYLSSFSLTYLGPD